MVNAMCFVLYAGTSEPIPRKERRTDAIDVSVEPLTERESPISTHFSKRQVQYIGSTSGCGCDFPHVMFQNGEWPWLDEAGDSVRQATDRYNRERLVALLRETGDPAVELYGVWDGDFDFRTPPTIRQHIHLDTILEPEFRFKEQGFYVVSLEFLPRDRALVIAPGGK